MTYWHRLRSITEQIEHDLHLAEAHAEGLRERTNGQRHTMPTSIRNFLRRKEREFREAAELARQRLNAHKNQK
jgi:hypothetical protein